MKNQNNHTDKAIEDAFKDMLKNGNSKGIFARIPSSLHDEVLEIKNETGKSIYDIVERALRLFVSEYKMRKGKK